MGVRLKRTGMLALILGFSACAASKVVVLEDNDANWKRSVEGSFVVYRIVMTGAPSYTEVVVPDEAAAAAFRSLVPQRLLASTGAVPAVSIRSLSAFIEQRDAGIAGLDPSDRPQAMKDRNTEIVRIQGDLKEHSAVVFSYENPPGR
jgi:hypothetical protein